MSNYNQFTILYGYCINDKFDYINDIENSEEKYWDGIPEFSLNYRNIKVGYKIVKDNCGKEELYFGVELYSCDEYDCGDSKCFNVVDLRERYLLDINKRYFELFKELPNRETEFCFICENV